MRGLPKDYDLTGSPNYLQHYANGPRRGWIYFLVADDLQLVKIGATNTWSKTDEGLRLNLDTRIRRLRGQTFLKLRLAAITASTPLGSENEHHDYFVNFRYRPDREWFWYIDELREYIAKVAEWDKAMASYVTACERYHYECELDPKGDEEGRIPLPQMPMKAPLLDFASNDRPSPKNTPTGWELKF